MPVALSASAAFQQHHFLSVLGDVTQKLSGFRIIYHCAAGHINGFIFSVFSETAATASRSTVAGINMTGIFQVNERPVVFVATQNDMSTPAAITSVGSALGDELLAVKMRRACSALSRTAVYFYVINKIGTGHDGCLMRGQRYVFFLIIIDTPL
ncbi:hypothetical protein SDC9_172972 [bioreactor metagenome]|uniref:Uncharacterized protein n=1 Tax=bioreactor metagenome TaxID=1076179 RepID=A0A645GHD3_9ZZZZ